MSDDGTTTGGGSCNDRMQTDGSSSTADSMQHNLFGMSDDGVSTDRGTGSTANVHNVAGSSSSSVQHSMAAGSGHDGAIESSGDGMRTHEESAGDTASRKRQPSLAQRAAAKRLKQKKDAEEQAGR